MANENKQVNPMSFSKIIRTKILECHIPTLQLFMVLIVSLSVVLVVAASIFRSSNYAPNQLAYTIINEETGYTDNGPQGVFSYGPYINLEKGNYEIIIYYETDTDTTFDICYRDESDTFIWIEEGALRRNQNTKTVLINNNQKIANCSFEVRTFYQGTGFLQVNGVSVKRSFVFDKYTFVTLLTILFSLLLICGRNLLDVLIRPKLMTCFGFFYTIVLCLCLYSMGYLVGEEKIWLHGVLNILIIIHAYISRKILQDNGFMSQYKIKYVCLIVASATIVMGTLYASVILDYEMNSDDVGIVYSISHVLSGKSNFFITDTGFTNLTHYLSYFLFGESLTTLYCAVIIEMFVLIFLGIWISAHASRNYYQLVGICIIWFYMFIPHIIPLDYTSWFLQRYHVNVNFCFLLILLCIQKLYEENDCSRSVYIFFAAILMYSYMQMDALNYVVNIVPLLGIIFMNYKKHAYKRDSQNRLIFWIIVITSACARFITSGLNRDGRYTGAAIQFSNLDEILYNAKNYITGILNLFDTIFYHTNVLSESTIYYFVKILLLILAIIIMCGELKKAIHGNEFDTLIVFMAISFIMVSVSYILSDTYLIPGSARYLNSIVYSFPIVLSRKLCLINVKKIASVRKNKTIVFVGIFLLLLIDVRRFSDRDFKRILTPKDYLSNFLVEHGLEYGYAEYWTAGRTSLASEGAIKLVPAVNGIVSGESAWIPYKDWFEDQQASFNFIVIPTSEEDPLTVTYGEPIEKYQTYGYDIYVYDYDVRSVSF